jgi:hypothetical protein
MGEVIEFARPEETTTPKRRRHEPQGYIMVPLRILEPLKRLEDSVNALAADHADTGKSVDWQAYYSVLACLEDAARYPKC